MVWWEQEIQGLVFPPSLGSGSAHLDYRLYEEFRSVSGHICNRLFSIGEDDFGTRRMDSFLSYLEGIKIQKGSFHNSSIIHVPRAHNCIQCQETFVFCRSHG